MLKNLFKVQKKIQIYSPVNGKCVDLKDVNDQMFAEKTHLIKQDIDIINVK